MIEVKLNDIHSIVPHRGRMLLLSRVNRYNLEDRAVEAEYDITGDCLFYDSAIAGVPAWVGFEFIAQTISAYSGIRDIVNGILPKMGFILSVASMRITLPSFGLGNTVVMRAREIERVGLVSTFEGEILLEGAKVLEGKITVMEIEQYQGTAG